MTDEERHEADEEDRAIRRREIQTVFQAKRLADEAAEEARHKGASPDAVQGEWLCRFEEELERVGFVLLGGEVPTWWLREQAISEQEQGISEHNSEGN